MSKGVMFNVGCYALKRAGFSFGNCRKEAQKAQKKKKLSSLLRILCLFAAVLFELPARSVGLRRSTHIQAFPGDRNLHPKGVCP